MKKLIVALTYVLALACCEMLNDSAEEAAKFERHSHALASWPQGSCPADYPTKCGGCGGCIDVNTHDCPAGSDK